jgi:hypothetical protein
MFASACSSDSTTTQPSTATQPIPPAPGPFQATTGPPCEALGLPPSLNTDGTGGEVLVEFRSSPPAGATNCAPMTILSNSPFIAVTSVSVNTGGKLFNNSGVRLAVAPNGAPAPRSGTVTIGDHTSTINQERGQIAVTLFLLDPVRVSSGTTECYIRGPVNRPTECIVQAGVTVSGGPPIVSYQWIVSYFPSPPLFNQFTTSPQITLTGTCGLRDSTPDGTVENLGVGLTLTDSSGNTISVQSGVRGQPRFQARLFSCGS